MKKRVNGKFTLILLILTLIFTSCSISLQKRRYTRGFYISTSKKIGNIKSEGHTYEDGNKAIDLEEVAETDQSFEKSDSVLGESIELNKSIVKVEDNLEMQEPTKLDNGLSFTDIGVEEEGMTIESEIISYPTPRKKRCAEEKKNKKDKRDRSFTKRHLAIVIGVSLLLMAIIAAFSFPAFNSIFVLGNPVATGLNLSANSGKFLGSIFGWIGIIILDLLVSWGIYKYYKKDKPKRDKKGAAKFDQSKLAGLSGIIRFIYTLFLIGATVALILAKTAGSVIQSYNFLSAFSNIWGWGLIAFGLHLIVLGLLYKNEGGKKKWLTILIKSLLILAGIGYMIQYIGILLVPNPVAFAVTIESIFIFFMIAGEIAFALWMIIKGGKAKAGR